jgi:hypothetical protein
MNERESWEELQERLDVLNGLERQVPLLGKNRVVNEVPRKGAAQMYRDNWDGCRDLWKLDYRQMKERRTSPSSTT